MPTRGRARKAQGSSSIVRAGDGPNHDVRGPTSAGPLDADPHSLTVPFDLDHHSFDHLPHDLLAFGVVVLAALHSAGMSEDRRRMALAPRPKAAVVFPQGTAGTLPGGFAPRRASFPSLWPTGAPRACSRALQSGNGAPHARPRRRRAPGVFARGRRARRARTLCFWPPPTRAPGPQAPEPSTFPAANASSGAPERHWQEPPP